VVPGDAGPQLVAPRIEVVDESSPLRTELEQLLVEVVELVQQGVSLDVKADPFGSAQPRRDARGEVAPSVNESRGGRFGRHEDSRWASVCRALRRGR